MPAQAESGRQPQRMQAGVSLTLLIPDMPESYRRQDLLFASPSGIESARTYLDEFQPDKQPTLELSETAKNPDNDRYAATFLQFTNRNAGEFARRSEAATDTEPQQAPDSDLNYFSVEAALVEDRDGNHDELGDQQIALSFDAEGNVNHVSTLTREGPFGAATVMRDYQYNAEGRLRRQTDVEVAGALSWQRNSSTDMDFPHLVATILNSGPFQDLSAETRQILQHLTHFGINAAGVVRDVAEEFETSTFAPAVDILARNLRRVPAPLESSE